MSSPVAALTFVVASVLQGEAGVLGEQGMRLVADSMLARREQGQSWDQVLKAYYAEATPSVQAIKIAFETQVFPWDSRGMPYVFSEEDARRLGLQVDFRYCANGLCICMAEEWIRD